ncbi:radical SAM protein [Azospirillum sp.]|uniref:radical SAM/SPASM domain-containing protein n=1 Tax=Azospirillum sp. TaxID=34012 RepID=UPI002D740FC3|nr:radical SAM protein [Azospirillum sp.]HYD67216.1 radical SAM protein [Azospirillum sp.]
MTSITARVDAITALDTAWRGARPPVPRSVKIELTARCDLQCFFCATGYKLRDKADIDWGLLTRLLKEMREAGVEEIGLFYLGESMLYPKLAEAIRFAKHECGYPYVFLTTNGRLAKPEKVRACMEAGLDSLKFSINAADPEQYKQVTRVDAFDKVLANLKAARGVRDEVLAATGHRCGLYASSILYDGEQQERMAATVAEIVPYVDEHYYLPLYNQAGFTAGAHGTKPVAGNIGRVGALREPLPCWAVFTEGHVTYDGKLSACCFDHDGRFDMGDLMTTSFTDAWHSEAFTALRAAHLKKDVTGTVCERCIAYQQGEA